jgi:hypothetical protein
VLSNIGVAATVFVSTLLLARMFLLPLSPTPPLNTSARQRHGMNHRAAT